MVRLGLRSLVKWLDMRGTVSSFYVVRTYDYFFDHEGERLRGEFRVRLTLSPSSLKVAGIVS